MQSRKYNSFEPRKSRTEEYGDSTSSRKDARATHTTRMYIDPRDPREGKIERENYLTKEDSKCVSENVTRSVVTRNVIDKRSSSSYKTREDSKLIKTRDLKGITSSHTDPSRLSESNSLHVDGEVKGTPVSLFYSSCSRDKDISGDRKFEKISSDAEDVISSFYRSGSGRELSDQNTKTEEASANSARASRYVESSSGGDGSSRFANEPKSVDFFGLRGSADRRVRTDGTASGHASDVSAYTDLGDTNIRRRSLERKQASNSLERERLAKRLSEEDSSDPLKHISSTHLLLSDKVKEKESGSSKIPLGTSYDRDFWRTTRIGKDEDNDKVDDRRDINSGDFKGKMRSRSVSLEALDHKERSRLGIYRELPGRKELLSYTPRAKTDDETEMSRESTRTRSLERDAKRMSRERRDSLLRLRSKSTDELRAWNRDNKAMYSSDRSAHLHRQGSTEWHRAICGDAAGRQDIEKTTVGSYSPREQPSTHKKLKEDIARLKAETETSSMGESEIISPHLDTTKPSIKDKLKEDIAKLKAETLTREHIKPFIPPSSSRVKSRNDTSREESLQPTIQDKLKEGIAKLKAETRNVPTLSKTSYEITTHNTAPDNKSEGRGNVHQSGVTTSSYERYAYSNRHGNVFQDEMRSKETQRYGYPDGHKYVCTKQEDKRFGADEDAVPRRDRTHSVKKLRDDYFLGSSGDYVRPTSIYDDPLPRPEERSRERQGFIKRKPEDNWSRTEERRLIEGEDPEIHQRNEWDEPLRTTREGRRGSTQGYATKRVFKADSTMSMTSTKNGQHGPSSVRGFFHGSVSEEDQSAYYSKDMGDKEDGRSREPFRTPERSRPSESFRPPEPFKRRESDEPPEPYRQSKSHWQTNPSSTIQSIRQSWPERSRPSESFKPQEPFRKQESPEPPDRQSESHLQTDPSSTVQSIGQTWPYRSKEPSTLTERSRLQDTDWAPDSSTLPDGDIPLPYPERENKTRHRDDSIVLFPTHSKDDPNQLQVRKQESDELSNQVQTRHEFITRKANRKDSISRKSIAEDIKEIPYRVDTSRRLSELSDITSRTMRIPEEDFAVEDRIISPRQVVETIREYKESKSSAMSELRKKIDQLKSKVDALDDSKSRGRLEKYVDEHSEKKPDVEIKDPVYIRRYQPSSRMPRRPSVIDDEEIRPLTKATDPTPEPISRRTSIASTTRRISSIREEDLATSPSVSATVQDREEAFPKEERELQKPVPVHTRDAETMTSPEVQEEVGRDRYQLLDSTITEVVDEPEIEELRGVPIVRRGTEPRIQEIIDTGDGTDGGVAVIQIDTEQQPLSPKKDKQKWWNASTAEDVDRLLELGDWGPPNAYTAEDMDRLWNLGPLRRRSFRRGSYERSSFRRRPRRSKDGGVDVHVRVRRQEKHSRPQYIIAQAAPEEKAIVLRESKESADPYIRKIKVDDVYGADAVRVENGIVKIKVGDLSTRGRKAWARILQQKDRNIESDGTVTIPVSRDRYEDGVYYTNYYEGQDQNGNVRIPIRFKIQEDDRIKTRKVLSAREIKRTGSMRRRRRNAGSRAYIVGARYYHGNILMSGSHGSQAQHQGMVVKRTRDGTRVAGNEIVLRGSQPYTVPMKTIQRIHAGHKVTRQAASVRNQDGKMVITVHAIPPRPPKFNLQQVGVNMGQTSRRLTSDSYYDSTSGRRDGPSSSRSYLVNSGSRGSHTSRGYTTYDTSGRQGTSYIVTDPSDSYPRRASRLNGVTRLYNSNEVSSTPTIIPYEDDSQTGYRTGNYSGSFVADPSSFYSAPGSRITAFDPRVNARTAYGERFNVRDYGDMSKVQYVGGQRGNSRVINDRRWANGRFKYGSSWNSRQHEKLNGRTMSWAVEEVTPDF